MVRPNKSFETDLRKRASLACSAAQWQRSATKRDNFCAVIELGGNKHVQLA